MRRILTVPSECIHPTQDNVDGNLVVAKGDSIVKSEAMKYMVIDLLGVGTFGQVFRCISNEGDEVAIKVVKSINKYFQYEMNEVRILKRLREESLNKNFVQLYDAFIYKQHLCIVVELLGKSMYDVTKILRYEGIDHSILKTLLKQVLEGLQELHNQGIVHCDLKPENILLADYFTYRVKLIDFGSSTTQALSSIFYTQSRFYRAPEVILGIPYSSAVDMWSFGCIAYELLVGHPLFPGKDNNDQILRIHSFCPNGLPLFMLERGEHTHKYFEKENEYECPYIEDRITIQQMIEKIYSKAGTKTDHDLFIDMILRALNPSYLERETAHGLLKHPFFSSERDHTDSADTARVGVHPLGTDSRRKMSMYDIRSFNMDDAYPSRRKGSLFDLDHENRYNQL